MKIKTWRDPYDAGFSPTKPTEIELTPGLTVLVGCNGAGKSTLLLNIKEYCKENKIPCHLYDNLHSGGSNAISELFYNGNYSDGAWLMSSSEGECIKANIGRDSTLYTGFFENGYIANKSDSFSRLFADKDKLAELDKQHKTCKDRVLLFDSVDSGLSVDSIIEVKLKFEDLIKETSELNLNIYIVIAANEYELARNSNCFDVNNGTYITFKDYEDYRSFIIKSRTLKEKRIKNQIKWRQKKKEQEINKYIKLRSIAEKRRDKFLAKLGDTKLSISDKYRLEDLNRPVDDFIRHSRFLNNEEAEKIWLKHKEV